MALSQNLTQTLLGTEGSTLTYSQLIGQKILILHLGDKRLNEVASSPTIIDFTLDIVTGTLNFGVDVEPDQTLHIVYRAI